MQSLKQKKHGLALSYKVTGIACAAAALTLIPEVALAVNATTGGLGDSMKQVKTLGDTVMAFVYTMAQIIGGLAFLGAIFLWKKRTDAGEQGASQYPWGKILSIAGFGLALILAGTLLDQTKKDLATTTPANQAYQFK